MGFIWIYQVTSLLIIGHLHLGIHKKNVKIICWLQDFQDKRQQKRNRSSVMFFFIWSSDLLLKLRVGNLGIMGQMPIVVWWYKWLVYVARYDHWRLSSLFSLWWFPSTEVSPNAQMDGWFHGTSQSKMDDLGLPPYDLGNTHVLNRAKPNAINNSMGFPGSPSRDGDKKAFFKNEHSRWFI